jgi:hypothetical protein
MNRNLAAEVERVVVDNASADDPSDAAGEWRGETRFIALERNLGLAPPPTREPRRHATRRGAPESGHCCSTPA